MRRLYGIMLGALAVINCAESREIGPDSETNWLICDTSSDCPEEQFCRSDRCVKPSLVSSDQCPKFEAGIRTPTVVESSFERIETIEDSSQHVWIEGNDIYWFDKSNALHAQRRDVSDSHQILRPADEDVFVVAMYADDSAIYWSEGEAQSQWEIEPPPWRLPGLLYSVPKQGGEVKLLHRNDNEMLIPVASIEDRLILRGNDSLANRTIFTIARDGTEFAEVSWDLQPNSVRVIDNQVYLLKDLTNGEGLDLWLSDFDGAEPTRITRIEGSTLLARNGRILWIQERMHTDPLVLDQNYVMFDQATGCTSTLPAVGESISFDSVMDDHHVYWFSLNHLQGTSSGDPATPTDPEITTPLIRVDLDTGALEQIVTPGFTLVLERRIVGQTFEALYLIYDGQLIAIDKP